MVFPFLANTCVCGILRLLSIALNELTIALKLPPSPVLSSDSITRATDPIQSRCNKYNTSTPNSRISDCAGKPNACERSPEQDHCLHHNQISQQASSTDQSLLPRRKPAPAIVIEVLCETSG